VFTKVGLSIIDMDVQQNECLCVPCWHLDLPDLVEGVLRNYPTMKLIMVEPTPDSLAL